MRKRLLAALLSITVVGILLLAALFTDIFYDNSVESAKNQLRVYMNFFDVSAPFTQESAETYAEKTGARVTFMQADGTVVADSFAPVQGETREDRAENLCDMLDGYFGQGAHHLNVNVFDRSRLIAAMEHPELYPNITVRVSGYAVNFHKLSRAHQLEVIKRTYHARV